MMHTMEDQSNSQLDSNGLKRTSGLSASSLVDLLGPWSEGADPLNEQLAGALSRAIDRGLLPPGTRLPAERELASELGLSRTTIVAAYDRLRQSGMVRSRQGSGTRVVARRPALAQAYDARRGTRPAGLGEARTSAPERSASRARPDPVTPGGDDPILLTIGALGAGPAVGDAIETAVREDVPALLDDRGYDPYGLPALRQAIAGHMGRLGVPTDANQILVTSGAQQALHLIASQLAGPDGAVAIENPTYIGAIDAFRAAGSRLLPIPVDRDGAVVDVIPLLAAGVPMRVAFVIPTYQNPSGAILPEARRRALAGHAAELGFSVVEDLTPDPAVERGVPPPVAAFDTAERVITVGSLSKIAWGGLRIGWLRASPAVIERLVAAKIVSDNSSSLVTQAIGVRVFERIDEIAEQTRAIVRHRRDLLAERLATRLPEWTFDVPPGGLSLWVRIADADAVAFTRLAASYGVVVRAGPATSPDGGYRDHVRIAYGAEPGDIIEGVERLAVAWAAYAPVARRTRSAVAVSV
jgi:DNA-binding transcriptional MocR family regulator